MNPNFDRATNEKMRRAQRRADVYAMLIAGLICISAILLLLAFAWGVGTFGCSNRWGDYTHEFRLLGGCMVEIDGRMTPQDKVRF